MAVTVNGWAQIAPYGDFPSMALVFDAPSNQYKRIPAIQRIDKQAVVNMVNEYASRKGVTRFTKSRPLYLGHPDVPGGERRWTDKSPKGVFSNLADMGGLYGEPVLTDEGEALVAKKKYYLSGRWEADDYVGDNDQGLPIYRASKFISAGLVEKPHLPVEMLNEKTPVPNTEMKKETIIAALTKHGVTIANDADEASVEAALHTTLARAVETAAAAKVVAVTADPKVVIDLQAQFANERTSRIERELGLAIESGRITAAEKPDWQRRLAGAEFANELTAMGKLPIKVKTVTAIKRGDVNPSELTPQARREFANEAIEEIAKSTGLDRKKDYNKIFKLATAARPDIFGAMKVSDFKGRAIVTKQ